MLKSLKLKLAITKPNGLKFEIYNLSVYLKMKTNRTIRITNPKRDPIKMRICFSRDKPSPIGIE